MSYQSFEELDQARAPFLDKIPASYQGHTCNLFLEPPRQRGLWRADLVLSAVKDEVKRLGERAKRSAEQQPSAQQTYRNLSTVWQAMTDDPGGAMILAEWAVAYTLLPEERRQARKERKNFDGAKFAMRGKPATPKQLEYLTKQGYTGEIRDRYHASELIDQYISNSKGA